MKRIAIIPTALCVCLLMLPSFSAFAAEPQKQSEQLKNVTITVVMPETQTEQIAEVEQIDEKDFTVLYPIDVTENDKGGYREIVKTYELSADEKPSDIPHSDFERGGYKYTLSDIIRKETATAETKPYKETVTLNTDSKELETILPLLEPIKEYKDDDGFVGVLSLDVGSIKVETAGTKTSSYEMKVTRQYPNLSSNDTSLVPKTVNDKGKTYTLASVDWRSGNNTAIDYSPLPEFYTAVATYTATGYSTRVTGYTTTAEYSGNLAKLSQGKTVYTAYFIGEEVRTPLEMVEETETSLSIENSVETAETTASSSGKTDENAEITETENTKSNSIFAVILPIFGLLAGVAWYFIKKKWRRNNAKTDNNAVSDSNDSDNDNSVISQ
jgi:hypothetical protein